MNKIILSLLFHSLIFSDGLWSQVLWDIGDSLPKSVSPLVEEAPLLPVQKGVSEELARKDCFETPIFNPSVHSKKKWSEISLEKNYCDKVKKPCVAIVDCSNNPVLNEEFKKAVDDYLKVSSKALDVGAVPSSISGNYSSYEKLGLKLKLKLIDQVEAQIAALENEKKIIESREKDLKGFSSKEKLSSKSAKSFGHKRTQILESLKSSIMMDLFSNSLDEDKVPEVVTDEELRFRSMAKEVLSNPQIDGIKASVGLTFQQSADSFDRSRIQVKKETIQRGYELRSYVLGSNSLLFDGKKETSLFKDLKQDLNPKNFPEELKEEYEAFKKEFSSSLLSGNVDEEKLSKFLVGDVRQSEDGTGLEYTPSLLSEFLNEKADQLILDPVKSKNYNNQYLNAINDRIRKLRDAINDIRELELDQETLSAFYPFLDELAHEDSGVVRELEEGLCQAMERKPKGIPTPLLIAGGIVMVAGIPIALTAGAVSLGAASFGVGLGVSLAFAPFSIEDYKRASSKEGTQYALLKTGLGSIEEYNQSLSDLRFSGAFAGLDVALAPVDFIGLRTALRTLRVAKETGKALSLGKEIKLVGRTTLKKVDRALHGKKELKGAQEARASRNYSKEEKKAKVKTVSGIIDFIERESKRVQVLQSKSVDHANPRVVQRVVYDEKLDQYVKSVVTSTHPKYGPSIDESLSGLSAHTEFYKLISSQPVFKKIKDLDPEFADALAYVSKMESDLVANMTTFWDNALSKKFDDLSLKVSNYSDKLILSSAANFFRSSKGGPESAETFLNYIKKLDDLSKNDPESFRLVARARLQQNGGSTPSQKVLFKLSSAIERPQNEAYLKDIVTGIKRIQRPDHEESFRFLSENIPEVFDLVEATPTKKNFSALDSILGVVENLPYLKDPKFRKSFIQDIKDALKKCGCANGVCKV